MRQTRLNVKEHSVITHDRLINCKKNTRTQGLIRSSQKVLFLFLQAGLYYQQQSHTDRTHFCAWASGSGSDCGIDVGSGTLFFFSFLNFVLRSNFQNFSKHASTSQVDHIVFVLFFCVRSSSNKKTTGFVSSQSTMLVPLSFLKC